MRKPLPLPDLEFLNTILKIDPTSPSGLRWKTNRRTHIKPGDIAGTNDGKKGWYVYITFNSNSKRYKTHRIVYFMVTNVGIRSNFADALKYPTTHYVLEPGVYYKRQHKLPADQPRPTQSSPGVIQEFVGFKDTPMMDWDVAGPYHAERNATIRHLGDVEERIQNYLSQNPQATLRLYQSPGGYRAFDLTTRATPTQYNPAFELLDVDPDYRIISQQKPDVLKYQGSIPVNDTERFNMRINPKVGRIDWVAQPIAQIAGTQAIVDPTSIRRVSQYHDEPIRQNFLQGKAQAAGIEKIKENLPTASQFLQNQIRTYLGL